MTGCQSPVGVRNSWEPVFAAEGFEIEVLDVGAEVGEAPGYVLVVADDDEGEAGDGDAGDVESWLSVVWRSTSYQMPGRVWAEVHVVGQHGFAGGGVRAGDDPVVGAGGAVGAGLGVGVGSERPDESGEE